MKLVSVAGFPCTSVTDATNRSLAHPQVSLQWKNPDFPLKNPDLLSGIQMSFIWLCFAPVLLDFTLFCSNFTPFGSVLLQFYSILLCSAPILLDFSFTCQVPYGGVSM